MNIRDLAALTGTVERQIRYMIAEGFVPPPRGCRSQPDYGEDHIDAVRRYLGLRALGLPPAAIKVLDETGGTIPLRLMPGLTLSIDAARIGRPFDVAAILERVAAVLNDLHRKTRS